MRDNFTKKELINSIYMQLGFSKKIIDNITEDFINIIIDNLGLGEFYISNNYSNIHKTVLLDIHTNLEDRRSNF